MFNFKLSVIVLFYYDLNLINVFMFDRYLIEEKSDDSILLILIIRIMDALGNYGNGHYM